MTQHGELTTGALCDYDNTPSNLKHTVNYTIGMVIQENSAQQGGMYQAMDRIKRLPWRKKRCRW